MRKWVHNNKRSKIYAEMKERKLKVIRQEEKMLISSNNENNENICVYLSHPLL